MDKEEEESVEVIEWLSSSSSSLGCDGEEEFVV